MRSTVFQTLGQLLSASAEDGPTVDKPVATNIAAQNRIRILTPMTIGVILTGIKVAAQPLRG